MWTYQDGTIRKGQLVEALRSLRLIFTAPWAADRAFRRRRHAGKPFPHAPNPILNPIHICKLDQRSADQIRHALLHVLVFVVFGIFPHTR
jgi:hypothetical protein